MKFRPLLLTTLTLLMLTSGVLVSSGWSLFRESSVGRELTAKASTFVASLEDKQLEQALLPYDTPKRVDWHFIPMPTRKGLMLREMSESQRETAHALLQQCLSEAGYKKATSIMNLEKLLYSLESPESRGRRDPLKYYFTLFGDPRQDSRWGLSVEGHHLSLNFVVADGKLIGSTPQFFASNPATLKTENSLGFKVGSQILKLEEELAFQLINDLDEAQQKTAIIAAKSLSEIRNANDPHPPQEAPAGIAASELNAAQQKLLRQLIDEYAQAIPAPVAAERLKEIEDAGFDKVHFAWAGALKPGIGHYYRIQGPSFVIEFVNTQPDAAGNPANHIHCVWRDMRGDFALSAK